ncbi:DUF1330 domain-containing protein [Novosphingobium aerophilum]|uniref:DUF1330 domain-containing protein n=1 Tax=Novosphingobium aerophilum TaxID=2839843 RepID=A0A7X1F4Q6_9SPHN|nr:DUF1330 domain-containing protein [Novosphingobium aerophilum]MBC2650372.1 DUF1330 domain-containing protein [Novosphingobium aerophilum]
MKAYVIVYRESPVRDPAAMEVYSRTNRENAATFMNEHGIKPLSIYGRVEALEGPAPDGVNLLEFPSMAAAKAWYESEAYQSVLALRQGAADWRITIVEGL